MLLNDLKKAALCVAAGFAVTMFGGCDSQKSTGAPAGAGAQRAPQVSVTEIQPTESLSFHSWGLSRSALL